MSILSRPIRGLGPRLLVLAAVLLPLCSGGAAFAEVFKWTDENGRVHYGDKKPEDLESRPLETPPPPDPNEVSRAERRLEDMLERATETDEAARDGGDSAMPESVGEQQRRQAECQSARRDLRVLQLQRPVYQLDENGDRVYLEDDQRAGEIGRAQDRVQYYCR